jgi:octaprenyl-diphosphate synthase
LHKQAGSAEIPRSGRHRAAVDHSMNADNKIFEKFQDRIETINLELDRVLDSKEPLAREMGSYALLGRGKRLRPLLFVLSAEICGYRAENTFRLSTLFEYVHAASLLHDDVLDNAEIRRSRPSVNRLWGNHAAVIAGDLLYCTATSLSLTTGNLDFLKRLSETSTRMAEGQILELTHTRSCSLSEEDYFRIITYKTAELISAACASPALLAGADPGAVGALSNFGANMGIAFQLIDDLLDYTSSEKVFGKPVGKDLREGKVTLPLIYAIAELEETDRERVGRLTAGDWSGDGDYDYVMNLVRRSGSLDRVYLKARSYSSRAAECLSFFPDCSARENLLEINNYIVERSY